VAAPPEPGRWPLLGLIQTIYFAGGTSGALGVPNRQAAMLLLLLPNVRGHSIEPATIGLRRVLAVRTDR
jgi:hypothetical protein